MYFPEKLLERFFVNGPSESNLLKFLLIFRLRRWMIHLYSAPSASASEKFFGLLAVICFDQSGW